ncbi:MAG: MmcQ/YjbR family DNA-binding protein, partial [Candidatus Acidiferrum sp.]
FKVAGKMFAHSVLVPAAVWLTFKASPEKFAELTERAGIIPAPYLARAQWVALETKDALSPEELAPLLRESYDMVVAKLPKRTQESLVRGKRAARVKPLKKSRAPSFSKKLQRKEKRPSRSRKGS